MDDHLTELLCQAVAISVPIATMATAAFNNDKPLSPRGSVVGVCLSGTIGLQATVAQWCWPIVVLLPQLQRGANVLKLLKLDSHPATYH
jgi:hypothetical protein